MIKSIGGVSRSVWRVSRLPPVGGGAVLQVADISKCTYIQKYQSKVSLIVSDFTFLEGRYNEIIKELIVTDLHINRVSSCL